MEKKRYYVGMRRFIILSSFIIGFVSFFISYNEKRIRLCPINWSNDVSYEDECAL